VSAKLQKSLTVEGGGEGKACDELGKRGKERREQNPSSHSIL
jgi:hypothetical protein